MNELIYYMILLLFLIVCNENEIGPTNLFRFDSKFFVKGIETKGFRNPKNQSHD